MKELYTTEATKTTPYVCVNYQTGKIEIKGRSSPENTMEFYAPFLKSIAAMTKAGQKNIVADFKLLYFNTSSARCIYLTVKELKKLEDKGKHVTINWFAEEDDEDMIETGLDFQDIVGIEFNMQMMESTSDYL